MLWRNSTPTPILYWCLSFDVEAHSRLVIVIGIALFWQTHNSTRPFALPLVTLQFSQRIHWILSGRIVTSLIQASSLVVGVEWSVFYQLCSLWYLLDVDCITVTLSNCDTVIYLCVTPCRPITSQNRVASIKWHHHLSNHCFSLPLTKVCCFTPIKSFGSTSLQ